MEITMSDYKKKQQMNTLTMNGGVVRDPEGKNTGTEKSFTTFDIANTRGFGDKAKTSYFKCKAWGKTADLVVNYLKKGSQISITGELRQDQWQDNNGETKSMICIYVREMQFIGSAGKKDDTPTGRAAQKVQDEFQGEDVTGETSAKQLFDDSDIPF